MTASILEACRTMIPRHARNERGFPPGLSERSGAKDKLRTSGVILKHAFVCAAICVVAAIGCAPDPYNVHPQALKVERIVGGGASLEVQPPRPQTGEYILLEGVPNRDGGIVHQPFYLTDVAITPAVGGAILARKSRYTEIFGLLSRGAAGEASSGRLVARVSLSELTSSERRAIDAENRDREALTEAFVKGKMVPAAEADAIRRVFAYARYEVMPPGVWVERQPGEWVIKGGTRYRERVMSREPIAVAVPSGEPAPATSSPATVEEPRPRVR
jgi:hypothetical protein